MQTANDMAFLWGFLATLSVLVVFAIGYMTHDLAPVERRARRMAIAAGVISAVIVGVAEWELYAAIDMTIGAFMLMPSVVLGMVAMWQGGRRAYRALGGGQNGEPETSSLPLSGIEPETLAHQGELWCRLRDLAHMRETLSGVLINLATGDQLYWTQYRNERCIEMLLAGKTKILASRYETLTRYLAVQEGIAGLLASFAGNK